VHASEAGIVKDISNDCSAGAGSGRQSSRVPGVASGQGRLL